MPFNKRFGIYRITFHPYSANYRDGVSFDTELEVKEYIKKSKAESSNGWVIFERKGVEEHKFYRFYPIKK